VHGSGARAGPLFIAWNLFSLTRMMAGHAAVCCRSADLLRFQGRRLVQLHARPNIFLIRQFLTEAEVGHLAELAAAGRRKQKFRGSKTDTDDGLGLNDTQYRTSHSMHIKKGADDTIRRVEGRAADLVGMPVANVEGLQLVSYTNGQSFDVHHDIGPIDDACEHVVQVVPPRRIVTLFVYLNDQPAGVGHTEFPLIGPLSVQPRRGSALLWCNVHARDPSMPDDAVIHCAKPVPQGHWKLGLNIWITDSNLQHLSL
jgi:prolyl 4-hydroxylase